MTQASLCLLLRAIGCAVARWSGCEGVRCERAQSASDNSPAPTARTDRSGPASATHTGTQCAFAANLLRCAECGAGGARSDTCCVAACLSRASRPAATGARLRWALQRASQRMPVCAERSVRQAATVACTGAGCAPLAIAIAARAVWGAKCIHFRDYANPRRGIKARGAATRLATTRRHRASLFCPVAQKRSARLWG